VLQVRAGASDQGHEEAGPGCLTQQSPWRRLPSNTRRNPTPGRPPDLCVPLDRLSDEIDMPVEAGAGQGRSRHRPRPLHNPPLAPEVSLLGDSVESHASALARPAWPNKISDEVAMARASPCQGHLKSHVQSPTRADWKTSRSPAPGYLSVWCGPTGPRAGSNELPVMAEPRSGSPGGAGPELHVAVAGARRKLTGRYGGVPRQGVHLTGVARQGLGRG